MLFDKPFHWDPRGMTFSTEWRDHVAVYDDDDGSFDPRAQRKFAGAALACVAFLCAWTLWTNLPGSGVSGLGPAAPRSLTASAAYSKVLSRAYAKLANAMRSEIRQSPASTITVSLFDARPLGFAPGTFAKTFATAFEKTAALVADGESAAPADTQSVAVQSKDRAAARRRGEASALRLAALTPEAASPSLHDSGLRDDGHAGLAAADSRVRKPSIFEKLFGKLAYAAPDENGSGGARSLTPGRYDRQTAVYDISAHMVYLPDGTTLEAHSGFGAKIDDPRHADEKMRGATPPTIYDLQLREGLFHGVQALRLIPLDEDKVFGRTGLLAHTYMLGANGQSNGCVSFRNYNAFLRAYLSGEIKRLAVVARLD
jgi:hypothetical protein